MADPSQVESDAALARRLQEEEYAGLPFSFHTHSSMLPHPSSSSINTQFDERRDNLSSRNSRLNSRMDNHEDDDSAMLIDTHDNERDEQRQRRYDSQFPPRRSTPYSYSNVNTTNSSYRRRPPPSIPSQEQQRQEYQRQQRQQYQSNTTNRHPYTRSGPNNSVHDVFSELINQVTNSPFGGPATAGLDSFFEQPNGQFRTETYGRPSRPSHRPPQFEYPQPQPSTTRNQEQPPNSIFEAFQQAFNFPTRNTRDSNDNNTNDNNTNENNTNENNTNENAGGNGSGFRSTGMFGFGGSGFRGGAFRMGSDGVVHVQTHFGSGPSNTDNETRRNDTSNNDRDGEQSDNDGRRRNGNNDEPFMAEFNSLNDLMSFFTSDGMRGGMPTGGMPTGGQGFMGGDARFMDILRSLVPNFEGNETYEDWINVIERMGGNVNRSATDAEINNIPVQKFTKDLLRKKNSSSSAENKASTSTDEPSCNKTIDEDEKCAICLGEFEEGDDVKILPCGHMFRAECIDRWLKVNRTCPFCKRSIRPSDGPSE